MCIFLLRIERNIFEILEKGKGRKPYVAIFRIEKYLYVIADIFGQMEYTLEHFESTSV